MITFYRAKSSSLPSHAITAEEMLADPALESRARGLSKQLRCLVCQINQSMTAMLIWRVTFAARYGNSF